MEFAVKKVKVGRSLHNDESSFNIYIKTKNNPTKGRECHFGKPEEAEEREREAEPSLSKRNAE